jgi:hypothetical protein
MVVRAVFLLLLALNIAAGMWLWLAPSSAHPALPPTDPGVAVLTLLGEHLGSLGMGDAAELATAPEPESLPAMAVAARPAGAARCVEIGPFQTQAELRQAETALAAAGRVLDTREDTERRFRGYWVYLPASANRSQALETARALATAGVRDYYVVTAGDRENTISLGLFRDRANAERRQAEMRSQGYQAELNERVEEQHVYWLGLEQPDSDLGDWRGLVAAPNELQARPMSCPR